MSNVRNIDVRRFTLENKFYESAILQNIGKKRIEDSVLWFVRNKMHRKSIEHPNNVRKRKNNKRYTE